MYSTAVPVALILTAFCCTVSADEVFTEDYETGYVDGAPLRDHDDWFFEQQHADPTVQRGVGVGGSWGVAPGDRAFTWTARPFQWNDPKLVSVTFGGDWQTDASGMLDDDRAGWSISSTSDSSDNICGVQIDPIGEVTSSGGVSLFGFQIGGRSQPEPTLNIEAYWDGDTLGDDGGRASIVPLPKLKPNAWYRLRAKFTKRTPASAKIEVTFTELDERREPTGQTYAGTLEDTSRLPDKEGQEKPNPAYFAAPTVWPVYKNFRVVAGGFDNAYFQMERTKD